MPLHTHTHKHILKKIHINFYTFTATVCHFSDILRSVSYDGFIYTEYGKKILIDEKKEMDSQNIMKNKLQLMLLKFNETNMQMQVI